MVILEKNLDNKKTAITEEYHHEMNLAKRENKRYDFKNKQNGRRHLS